MKIGIAGPMTLKLLGFDFKNQNNLPKGYDFPMISMLINAILKKGHSVVAYTTSTGIDKPIVHGGKDLTVCIGRRREHHSARDLFSIERRDLTTLMRNHPVDIINAHWSYEFAWAAINTRIPTIVTLHDHALTILRYQTDPYRFMRLIMNYVVLMKARYLSTNSQYLYNLLNNRNKKKARIITNFYSTNHEENASAHMEKSSYLLSVSNGFGRLKNISTALKAFVIVRQNYPDVEYHLIGEGMEISGPVYRYALQNNLTEGVRFIGKVPYNDVIKKMKRALVLLHPSREESFGMVALEAMIMGTPIVGGKKSGNIPYLLNHGNAGSLCDVNSPHDLAKCVIKLLKNPDLSELIIKKAAEFAKVNFSEEITTEAYLAYYRNILYWS